MANARTQDGFTIVELMVAIALMVILTGAITFVFIQANKLFVVTDAKIQVYQNARYALDQMERDLANAEKTIDMEWFKDEDGDTDQLGHYDLSTSGTVSELYQEFASQRGAGSEGDFPGPGIIPEYDYLNGMVFMQPDSYTGVDREEHRRDSIYFRTMTTVDGETQSALICYKLEETDTERPVLRRWLSIMGDDGRPVWLQPEDMCYYVTDMRVELYYTNHRREAPGLYLTPEELISGVIEDPTDLRGAHFDSLSAEGSYIQCIYQGTGRLRLVGNAADQEVRFEAQTPSYATEQLWPMLRPGDTIYLMSTESQTSVETMDYTIDEIKSDVGGNYLTFRESIDMGPGNTTVSCIYRAAWLPSSVQITLHIKDAQSRETRIVSRVVNLLAQ